MSEDTAEYKARRGRPPKTASDPLPDTGKSIPHHPPITQHGFRDEALQAWMIEHYPDLANLALTGRITNQTQP